MVTTSRTGTRSRGDGNTTAPGQTDHPSTHTKVVQSFKGQKRKFYLPIEGEGNRKRPLTFTIMSETTQ